MGFEYQDLCALLRVAELYETGAKQFVQVEDRHTPLADRTEPWDIRILNSSPPDDWAFTEELWQAKDTPISKNQCFVYWKNLHRVAHGGELECAASAAIRNDVVLGLVTSARLHRDIERFSQFTECLRNYHRDPGREDLWEAVLEDYTGVDLDEIATLLTNGKDVNLGMFDHARDSNGSLYWFRRFAVASLQADWVRDRTLLSCARRLGLGIPDAEDAYESVCGAALALIRRNYGDAVPFEELVDLLAENKRVTPPARKVVKDILAEQREAAETSPASEVPIADLFVNPLGTLRSSGSETPEPIQAFDWLAKKLEDAPGSLTLLLGDFGHGKTTLLKVLAARSAKRWKEGDPIPVFIPLRRFFEGGQKLSDLVADALAHRVDLTQDIWRQHRWWILCDGFDELNAIHQDRPDWVRNRFDRLYQASRSPNVSLVISSRPILFMDPEARADYLKSFDRIMLEPFTDKQITQWLGKSKIGLTLDDLKDRGLSEIVRTPVILDLVSQLFRAGALADRNYRRVDVYRRFFEWVAETGGALDEGELMPKHEGIPIKVLRKIAIMLFSHDESQAGMMWVPLLLHELKKDGLQFDERLFVRHAFREGMPDYVEFLHQSLREYLVADHCYHAIFDSKDSELGPFDPNIRELLFARHLTQAKIEFFREIVEGKAADHDEGLRDALGEEWDWSRVLWLLNHQVSSELAERADELTTGDQESEEAITVLAWDSYMVRAEDDGFERMTSSSAPDLGLGNAALLVFLAKAYYLEACGEERGDFADDLSSLLRFLSSTEGLSHLVTILGGAIGGLAFRSAKWGLRCDDFRGFAFDGNAFLGTTFTSCTFEKTVFRNCRFKQVSFIRCTFKDCSFDSPSFEDTSFEHCWFDDETVLPREASLAVFNRCILEAGENDLSVMRSDQAGSCWADPITTIEKEGEEDCS